MKESIKYKNLYNELLKINKEMDDLINFNDELKKIIENFIIIDNKLINDDKLENIKKEEENVKNMISDYILPNIKNKMQ